jgi:hypothetical protein
MARDRRGHGRLDAQRDVVPVVPVVATAVVPPWLPSPTHKGSCSRRRRWSLTKAIGTATTMSTRAVTAPRSRPHKPRTSNHGAAGGFDHGDRVSRGGNGRPRRSDWRWAASSTAATAWRRSSLVRRQRAASEIWVAAGGFDHGGHGLHHGGTTSMAASPDLGPTCLDPGAAHFSYS